VASIFEYEVEIVVKSSDTGEERLHTRLEHAYTPGDALLQANIATMAQYRGLRSDLQHGYCSKHKHLAATTMKSYPVDPWCYR